MGLHSGPSLRSEVFLQKEDNMKVTLACFVLIWSVLAEVGNTLKCWECVSNYRSTSNRWTQDELCPEPDNFGNTTFLTKCEVRLPNGTFKSDGAFCFKAETKDGTMHGCMQRHFDVDEWDWKETFQEKPKMNGDKCFATLPTYKKDDAGTWCFCNYDGCNSSGPPYNNPNGSSMTKLSLILLSVVGFRCAYAF